MAKRITHTHRVTESLTLPLHWLVESLECGDEANKYFVSFKPSEDVKSVHDIYRCSNGQ